jgi:hypothetical protein
LSKVLISDNLAGALINLISVGRFPFEYGQIKQVEMELYKAIENSNVQIEYTEDPAAASEAVMRLVKEGEE